MLAIPDPLYMLLGGGLGILMLLGVALLFWPMRSSDQSGAENARSRESAALLFQSGELVDASEAGQELIGDAINFDEAAQVLSARFPALRDVSAETDSPVRVASDLPDDSGYLEIRHSGDTITIVLEDPGLKATDRHHLLELTRQNQLLKDLIEEAPWAIWSSGARSVLPEGNATYREICDTSAAGFDLPDTTETEIGVAKTRRIPLVTSGNAETQWYDVTRRHDSEGTVLNYAANADAIVSAEAAQRNFVQTLTKTFAQLSIGLAIFDRKRQLALFNPALIDLTMLPADVLSGRPSLNLFFDQLRERQIMPEPRNYKNWRDQLSDMLAAAQDGQYCETWTLPSGLTYRISGKPHPDGAVAFLFEDISAEISLTRRFRAELELSQAALDALDTAIAVFSHSGTLTFSNGRFKELWKCSPDESFIEMTILDLSNVWHDACEPSPIWGDLRSYVTALDERAPWRDSVMHKELGELYVDTVPLSGGATLVKFEKAPFVQQPMPKLEDAPQTL